MQHVIKYHAGDALLMGIYDFTDFLIVDFPDADTHIRRDGKAVHSIIREITIPNPPIVA